MEKFVEIEYKNKNLFGLIVFEDEKEIVLKLNSGYNTSLLKENITKIKEIKKNLEKIESIKKISLKKNPNLLNIALLHTGGTIASKVDYRTGAVSSTFTPEELLELYPEFLELANISPKNILNIFSEDFRFCEYNILLEEIKKCVSENFDAIIITQGTDTLHYTSSALQYSLKNLNIPIILVGAQRSLDRPSSDAFLNLKSAILFLNSQKNLEKKFLRVGICMHENLNDESFLILDGLCVKKMHSTKRCAFKQINYSPFARVFEDKIEILREELLSCPSKNKFNLVKYDENLKGCFFKVHPNLFLFEIEQLKNYDFVVLEGTGVGNISANISNEKKDNLILLKLKEVCKKIKVLASTQTTFGEVSLDIYSRGKDIQNYGVIGNRHNLTSETIFLRTAFCLSQKKKVLKKYGLKI